MSPHDEAALTKECEALRRTIHDLNVRAGSVEQRLAALTAKCLEMTENERIGAAGLTPLVEAMIPAIREVIRQEMKCLKPLDEPWYGPSEVEAISCGRVRAGTLRNWLRWGQIDGESDGNQVRLPQSTVDALRKNKWKPLRQPDPSKVPPSKRPRNGAASRPDDDVSI